MRRNPTLWLTVLVLAVNVGCGDGGSSGDGTGGPSSGFEQECVVRFGVTSEWRLATLEAWVDYRDADGRFVGGGHEVECERTDDRWAVWAVNQCRGDGGDCGEGEKREITLIGRATHDIATPIGLTECRFEADEVPLVEDFRPVVAVATDEYLLDVAPSPVVEVTDIICRSTSATTSTTLEPSDPCEGVSCPDNQACVEGSCEATFRYAVDVFVDGDESIGALQLDVRYDCKDGEFDGETSHARCVGNPDLNASILFNDYGCSSDLGSPRVVMSFVSLDGFQAPVRLATCEYTSATGAAPVPASFPVDVVDASDPGLAPISGVTASVAVRPIGTP